MTDYSKLVEALRCKSLSKQCDSCKYGYRLCPDSECNDACHVEQIYADAADAVEQLPKLGEWYTELYDGDKKYQCSNCLTHWDVETRYCPFCGAKMGGTDADRPD